MYWSTLEYRYGKQSRNKGTTHKFAPRTVTSTGIYAYLSPPVRYHVMSRNFVFAVSLFDAQVLMCNINIELSIAVFSSVTKNRCRYPATGTSPQPQKTAVAYHATTQLR